MGGGKSKPSPSENYTPAPLEGDSKEDQKGEDRGLPPAAPAVGAEVVSEAPLRKASVASDTTVTTTTTTTTSPPPPQSPPPPHRGSTHNETVVEEVTKRDSIREVVDSPRSPQTPGTPAHPPPPPPPPQKQMAPGGSPFEAESDRPRKKLLNGANIEFRYPSGSKYCGSFKDGKLHGHGRYIYFPSGDVYEGEWWNDMKHGHGTYLYESGDRYVGEWRNGKKHGRGSYTFASGDEYVGEWRADKIHGYGVFVIVRNGNRYEGEWKDSYRHGHGVLLSGNGDRYEGQWARGKEEGMGVLAYLNGNRYCGDWKLGQMDGKGVLIEQDTRYLVEHISGYMISNVPADPNDIDPEWAAVWQFAEAHLRSLHEAKDEAALGRERTASNAAGITYSEVEAIRKERDDLRVRVEELLRVRADADTLDENEMKERILQMSTEADASAKELNECRTVLDAAASSLEEKDAELATLREQLEAVATSVRHASAAAAGGDSDDNIGEETASLERLRQLEAQLALAKQDALKEKQTAATHEKTIQEMTKAAAGAKTVEDPSLKAKVAALTEQNAKLQEQAEGLKEKLAHAADRKEDMLELQARLELAEASSLDHNGARKELQAAYDANKELQGKQSAWQTREAELLADLKSQREKTARSQEQIEAMNLQFESDLAAAGSSNDEKTQDLTNRIAELEEKVKKLKKKHKDTETKLTAADTKIQTTLQEQTNLHQNIAALNTQIADNNAEYTRKADLVEGQLKSEKDKARRLFNTIEDMKGKIRVFVRTRPFLHTEKARKDKMVISFPDEMTVAVNDEKTLKEKKEYLFDTTFPADSAQERVFDECKHLIQSAVDGFNVCIFAYGQTGSGKTFTLGGSPDNPGVAPRSMSELFQIVEVMPLTTYSISCYMVELYNDKLNDLLRGVTSSVPEEQLSPEGDAPMNAKDAISQALAKEAAKDKEKEGKAPRLDIKKDQKGTVTIPGVNIVRVASLAELSEVYLTGQSKRNVRMTKMNDASSRSHLVFSILIETTNTETKQTACGKLSIVDLAGSERLAKTGVEDPAAIAEAQNINLSLTALGNVISALSSGQKHVPYRDNKLTMLMSDSLGGNAKTLMFVNISPANYNTEETISSLNYASRVKLIKNNPAKTIETAEIKRLKAMITKLKGQSAMDDYQDINDANQNNGGAPEAPKEGEGMSAVVEGAKALKVAGARRRSVSPRPA